MEGSESELFASLSLPSPTSAADLMLIDELLALDQPQQEQLQQQMRAEQQQRDQLPRSTSSDPVRRARFAKTAAILSQSGLLNVTLEMARMIKHNQVLNQEIEKLREESLAFVQSVLSNPENRWLKDEIERSKRQAATTTTTTMTNTTTISGDSSLSASLEDQFLHSTLGIEPSVPALNGNCLSSWSAAAVASSGANTNFDLSDPKTGLLLDPNIDPTLSAVLAVEEEISKQERTNNNNSANN